MPENILRVAINVAGWVVWQSIVVRKYFMSDISVKIYLKWETMCVYLPPKKPSFSPPVLLNVTQLETSNKLLKKKLLHRPVTLEIHLGNPLTFLFS